MKTHLYFMPGLAANPAIFDRIRLPLDKFELHFLEWILPASENEPLQEYAKRMCEYIQHENPILIGVSFGGILVQEMSKYLTPKKIIIISSIKNAHELPVRLRLTKTAKIYKLFPQNSLTTLEGILTKVFGELVKRRIQQYQTYLSVRHPLYLNWAIYNALHWEQKIPLPNVVHIHGNEDKIFPIKHISNCIEIEGGSHVMILNKAREISGHLLSHLQ